MVVIVATTTITKSSNHIPCCSTVLNNSRNNSGFPRACGHGREHGSEAKAAAAQLTWDPAAFVSLLASAPRLPSGSRRDLRSGKPVALRRTCALPSPAQTQKRDKTVY